MILFKEKITLSCNIWNSHCMDLGYTDYGTCLDVAAVVDGVNDEDDVAVPPPVVVVVVVVAQQTLDYNTESFAFVVPIDIEVALEAVASCPES